jgi:hypothetical protein
MRILRTDYTFDASAHTVIFTGDVTLGGLLLITNVTDNIIIYDFGDPLKGGSVSVKTLTLTYNSSTMSDTDTLQIFYDDAVTSIPVSGVVSLDAIGNAPTVDTLTTIMVELKLISELLNEGLNLNADLDLMRKDIIDDLEIEDL